MTPKGIDIPTQLSRLDIASRRSVIAAVSGGSDSTALLLLTKDHISAVAPGARLVAVTVDHALRAGSDSEAQDVARLCARLGIAHRIETWTGEKPATGIPAAAREARHALLSRAAQDEGTDLVLTGHTANDQAETVLMRQERSSGDLSGRGLAGIAPATLFEGKVWFARPLLETPRAALRGFLQLRGVGWVDDPTNIDMRFERPRQRAAMSGSAGDAGFVAALEQARRMAMQRADVAAKAARIIDSFAQLPAPGLLRLDAEMFDLSEKQAVVYALRLLLAVMGGTTHLPDQERAAALVDRLSREESMRAVLSRALADRRKAGIFVLREARDLPASEGFADGATWDGRYRLTSMTPDCSRIATGHGGSLAPESLLRKAAAGQPRLGPGLAAVPLLAPFARYLPSFDLEPARAIARLLGAVEVPAPPFHGHIESKA
ncbi:MAG: tRNA lysidine(34) synthetase TilS [Rhizobiaceae bacterium]|nr:tRNA lysidine(34) synthetase TilS [Rhizobiaceae bacterium]